MTSHKVQAVGTKALSWLGRSCGTSFRDFGTDMYIISWLVRHPWSIMYSYHTLLDEL
jgi:hypothetical protein